LEDKDLFTTLAVEDFAKLANNLSKLKVLLICEKNFGRCFDKIPVVDRAKAKISVLMDKMYKQIAWLLAKTVDASGIERLVLLGRKWQINHFEDYLDKGLRNEIAKKQLLLLMHQTWLLKIFKIMYCSCWVGLNEK
jgi:hypothetical protein